MIETQSLGKTYGVVAGILTLGAAFTVAAVVRLSLYARRDELEIMQLVGAPFSYIRGPFIMEGLLLGGMGAAAAWQRSPFCIRRSRDGWARIWRVLRGVGQLRFLGLIELAVMVRADWPWGPPRERWHREPSDDIR